MTAEEILDSLGIKGDPNPEDDRKTFCERFDTQINCHGVAFVWVPANDLPHKEAWLLPTEHVIPRPPRADHPLGYYEYIRDRKDPALRVALDYLDVRKYTGRRTVFPPAPPKLSPDELSAFALKIRTARRANPDMPTWLTLILLDAERGCDSAAHSMRELKLESLECPTCETVSGSSPVPASSSSPL